MQPRSAAGEAFSETWGVRPRLPGTSTGSFASKPTVPVPSRPAGPPMSARIRSKGEDRSSARLDRQALKQ